MESYNGVTVWPETAAQSPQDLAKAGFIYQGDKIHNKI